MDIKEYMARMDEIGFINRINKDVDIILKIVEDEIEENLYIRCEEMKLCYIEQFLKDENGE